LSRKCLCFYLQSMAILTELGSSRLSAVLGVEHEQVSLAACNLLHVMFDSLKEGMQKDFRGKEDAVVLGECLLPQLANVVWETLKGGLFCCLHCCGSLPLGLDSYDLEMGLRSPLS